MSSRHQNENSLRTWIWRAPSKARPFYVMDQRRPTPLSMWLRPPCHPHTRKLRSASRARIISFEKPANAFCMRARRVVRILASSLLSAASVHSNTRQFLRVFFLCISRDLHMPPPCRSPARKLRCSGRRRTRTHIIISVASSWISSPP